MSNVCSHDEFVGPKILVDCTGFGRGCCGNVANEQGEGEGDSGVDVPPLLGLNAALSLSLDHS